MDSQINEKIIKNSYRKIKIDKITKTIFTIFAIFIVIIIFFTLGYLIYSGLKPFFKTYTIEVNDPSDPLKTIKVSGHLSFFKFINGNRWNNGEFDYSIGWLILNTIYLTILSLLLSVPLGILSALFITKMSNKYIGKILSSIITLLSSIPSVIIGVFAMGVILPGIKNFANLFSISTSGGRSILAAIITLAMISFPIITTMTVTAIKSVDNNLIISSLALGASKVQTNFKVVLKACKSTIFASIILAMGRALGEATAIQMVTGALSGPTFFIFDNTATLTTIMLTGMGEASYGSLNYDARFAAGLFLMLIILLNNLLLNYVMKKIEKKEKGIITKNYSKILTKRLNGEIL